MTDTPESHFLRTKQTLDTHQGDQMTETMETYKSFRASILRIADSLDGVFRPNHVDDGGCLHTFEIMTLAGGGAILLHTRRTTYSVESVVDWDVWEKKGETSRA